MVPFLKKYPWCTVLRLLLSLQQQLLPQVSPTQQQHQPIRFAPFKSFLSWIPELRISTLLQIHSAVAMAIAQSPGKISHLRSDRCLFRARTLANSSCVVLHYFLVLFCMSLLCFDVKISFLIYTYTQAKNRPVHTHIHHSILVWFPLICHFMSASRGSGKQGEGELH